MYTGASPFQISEYATELTTSYYLYRLAEYFTRARIGLAAVLPSLRSPVPIKVANPTT